MTNHNITFGLVHGSWHGAWCWELVQDELNGLGYDSVAVNLPIDNPHADFNDHADVVVDRLKDVPDLVMVGHSRAGNIIPRAAGGLAVEKLIYLCSSFDPPTIGHPTPAEAADVPQRNNPEFLSGIKPIGDSSLFLLDEDVARSLFFNDCSEERREWAIGKLRPQRRTFNEPELGEWPETPQDYIICTNDLVINPEWSHYAARNWLGVEPVEFDSGHSPFLAKPKDLAKLLISLVE